MHSKILMTSLAIAAVVGATSLTSAQTSPPSNAAAAEKQQNDGTNAENQAIITNPAPRVTPPAASPNRETSNREKRLEPGSPSGDTSSTTGSSGAATGTQGAVGSSGSGTGSGVSGQETK